MTKSPDAFRTISEVADWLGVQAHVLRFWESKFAQVKPIKRAGGRRYYRPADMLLLGGIKKLLHDDGLTIKGAQKLLREKGVAFVADLSQPLDDLTMAVIEGDAQLEDADGPEQFVPDPALAETAQDDLSVTASPDGEDENDDEDAAAGYEPVFAEPDTGPAEAAEDAGEEEPSVPAGPAFAYPPDADSQSPWLMTGDDEDTPELHAEETVRTEAAAPLTQAGEADEDAEEGGTGGAAEDLSADVEETAVLPSFRSRHRVAAPVPAPDPTETEAEPQDASPEPAAARKPTVVDVPRVPPASEIEVAPALLSAVVRVKRVSPELAREIKPHLARLTRLRASMAKARKDIHKD